ncbi:MAG: hypothetical protein K5891_04265 [Lachnospiraceae bacterium]|nr:hypothetical protein [Lachnospiraceae bacterium]
MKDHLTHRLWMLALSLMTEIIAGPVALLFSISDVEKNEKYAFRMSQTILHFLSSAYPVMLVIIAVVGAAIVAIGGFYYLLQPQATDLYHSLPVKREKLFSAVYLNGILIWAVPLLINWLLVTILSAAFIPGEYLGKAIGYCFGVLPLVLIAFLLVYHLFLTGTMLSGNVLCALLSSGILGTFVLGCWGTWIILMEAFCYSFVALGEELPCIYWLSPLVTPFALVASYSRGSGWKDLLAELPVSLIGSILLIALLLLAAVMLYNRRKSEQSISGLVSRPAQILMSIPTGLISGTIIARFVVELRYDSGSPFWEGFFCLFCSVLSVFLLNLAFLRSFRAVFAKKLRLILIPVATLGIYLVFRAGLIPYENILPDASNIQSARVYSIYPFYESNYAYDIRDQNELERDSVLLEDPELIRGLCEAGVSFNKLRRSMGIHPFGGGYIYTEADAEPDPSLTYYTTVEIRVKRRFGGTFSRTYQIPETSAEVIRPLVESRAYQEKFYPMALGHKPMPDSVIADWYDVQGDTWRTIDLPPAQIDDVLAAYSRDFAIHHTLEELDINRRSEGEETSASLQLEIQYMDETKESYDSWDYINIPSSFSETRDLVETLCREYVEENKEYYQNNSYYQ